MKFYFKILSFDNDHSDYAVWDIKVESFTTDKIERLTFDGFGVSLPTLRKPSKFSFKCTKLIKELITENSERHQIKATLSDHQNSIILETSLQSYCSHIDRYKYTCYIHSMEPSKKKTTTAYEEYLQ